MYVFVYDTYGYFGHIAADILDSLLYICISLTSNSYYHLEPLLTMLCQN